VVTATLATSAVSALTAPVRLDGRTIPGVIAALTPPRHLAIRGRFPHDGVVLTRLQAAP
jgi:hypothetical protein